MSGWPRRPRACPWWSSTASCSWSGWARTTSAPSTCAGPRTASRGPTIRSGSSPTTSTFACPPWSLAASINLWEDGDLVKNSPTTAVFVGRADPSVNIGPRQIFFDATSDGFNYQYLTNSPETTDYKPAAVRVGTSSADYAFITD